MWPKLLLPMTKTCPKSWTPSVGKTNLVLVKDNAALTGWRENVDSATYPTAAGAKDSLGRWTHGGSGLSRCV